MSLVSSAVAVLSQIKDVILQIPDEEYSRPIPQLSDASIGQHVRHTLEFFGCLLTAEHRVINYDARQRDFATETITSIACKKIDQIISSLNAGLENRKLDLIANFGIEKDDECIIDSSVDRELVYNIEHAIHHMALIKVGIRFISSEILLPEDFGVASSTIRYRQEIE